MQCSSLESNDTTTAAVLTIQTVWRNNFRLVTSCKVVDAFIKHGPSIQRARSLTSEALAVFLSQDKIVSVTQACFWRICVLTVRRHGEPSAPPRPDNVHAFLYMYPIAFHSANVFESMGTLEKALLDAATRLLDVFVVICKELRTQKAFQRVSFRLTETFLPTLSEFMRLFNVWKVPDRAKLVDRVRLALKALYDSESHLPPDMPSDSKLRLDFKTQIKSLRGKLEQLAGADALRDFDAERGGVASAHHAAAPPIALPLNISNDVLTHELLLDRNFQFRECDFFRSSGFEPDYYTSLIEDMSKEPPRYTAAIRFIDEIKRNLCSLSPAHKPCLDEVIDIPRIYAQIQTGKFRWANCACGMMSAVYGIVRRLSPSHRKDVLATTWTEVRQALESKTPAGFCHALKFLTKCVKMLQTDAANERLKLIAPIIEDHGVEYERGRFQDRLQSGTHTLERTVTTIGWVVDRMDATTIQALMDGAAPAYVSVHLQMMQSLVLVNSKSLLLKENCPETLLLDVGHLNELRDEFIDLTFRSSALTILKNALRAQPSVLAVVTDRLCTIVWVGSAASLVIDAMHDMGVRPEMYDELLQHLRKCEHPNDSVRQLMFSRLKHIIASGMHDGRLPASVHLTKTIAELAPRAQDLLTRLFTLTSLNYKVHRNTYCKITREAAMAKEGGV